MENLSACCWCECVEHQKLRLSVLRMEMSPLRHLGLISDNYHLIVYGSGMGKSRTDQILDALSANVILIDEDRTIVFANKTACARFGANIVNNHFIRIVRDPDCLSAIDAILSGETERELEITLGFRPSATFAVKVLSLGPGGVNNARAAITLEDISQIKDAQLMRSEFVANVSHELRSPLTALAGFIETLKGPAKDDEGARFRFLDLMEHEAARMKRLIDDLLSLSKLQSQERIKPTERIHLDRLIERVIATLIPLADKENTKIEFTNGCDVAHVIGNEDELTQVFHNVIENAIKYGTAETKVNVSLDYLERINGISGGAIAVSVQDHGGGIVAEDIPRLTERFYRVDKSRSRIQGGTGLGLAIVKHILNRHRGLLQIESQIGEGSIFTVLLPALLPESKPSHK
jgi:two-component system phosphate regulon sensor histidine kinase PhoR